jgi:hypothetical protein
LRLNSRSCSEREVRGGGTVTGICLSQEVCPPACPAPVSADAGGRITEE